MTAQSLPLPHIASERTTSRPARPRPGVGAGHDVRLVVVLAFAATVLGIGWAGVFMPAWKPADFQSDGPEPATDAPLMVEVAIRRETAPPASVDPPASQVPVAAAEQLPEPVAALTVEDVFAVPSPPELVTPFHVERTSILRAPPASPSARPPQSQPRLSPPNSAAAVPGPPPGSITGGGRGGKAKMPQPPYPAFARSGKMTGTVVVSLLVDAAGGVASATVVRSCGHAALDNYTCGYIRRSWHWPEGGRRTFTQPVTFRLR